MTRVTSKLSNLISLAAAAGMAVSPIALAAQDAPAAGQAPAAPEQPASRADTEPTPFGLPDSVTLLGEADPNMRTATAVVNGHVVTGTDVNHRVALLLAANEQELSAEDLQTVRMQVLRNLIDETLQIQAAAALDIPVEQEEVDQSYMRLAGQNFGQNPDAMDAYLISVGSSPVSLKRQIQGEIAWQKLIRRNVAPFVNVSEEEVREVLGRLEASRGTEEYRLGEIYLAASPENAATVEQNARNLVEQLRAGGSFMAYARQFSQASTAAVGGDLGWVRLAQLPAALGEAAQQLQPGQLVGPVAIPGGYSILVLIDKRQVLMADPRDAVLSLKQISMDFQPGMKSGRGSRTRSAIHSAGPVDPRLRRR